MKRIFILMLIAVMICPMLSVGTSAEAWDGKEISTSLKGDGTAQSPILIESAADLACLAVTVNNGTTYEGKYITQTADIDLGGKEWTPIGRCTDTMKELAPFSGVYDGKGHKITGLDIRKPTSYDTGLFGYVAATKQNEAGIANLTLEGSIRIDGPKSVGIGGLVGRICLETVFDLKDTFITNCSVDVDVTLINCKNQPRVGGVFGYCNLTTVDNLVSNGNISVRSSVITRIGGIVGEVTASDITNTVNNGNVDVVMTAGEANVSGVAGKVCFWKASGRTLVLDRCVNNGDVTLTLTTGKCFNGGVVGGHYADDKKTMDILVVDCANTGDISSTADKSSYYPYTGGIYCYASYARTAIVRCINTGKITSTGGLDERPGDIISVMNNASEKTLFCKDCICTGTLSAYIVNDKSGCIEKADNTLVDAAVRSLVESICPSIININGFDTSGIPAEPTIPLIIETTAAPEAPKAPEAGMLSNQTTAEPEEKGGDAATVAAIVCCLAAVLCCCIVPAVRRKSRKS